MLFHSGYTAQPGAGPFLFGSYPWNILEVRPGTLQHRPRPVHLILQSRVLSQSGFGYLHPCSATSNVPGPGVSSLTQVPSRSTPKQGTLSRRLWPEHLPIPSWAPYRGAWAGTPAPAQFPVQVYPRAPQASVRDPVAQPARRVDSAQAATHPGSHRCGRAASPSPAAVQPNPRPQGAWFRAQPTRL